MACRGSSHILCHCKRPTGRTLWSLQSSMVVTVLPLPSSSPLQASSSVFATWMPRLQSFLFLEYILFGESIPPWPSSILLPVRPILIHQRMHSFPWALISLNTMLQAHLPSLHSGCKHCTLFQDLGTVVVVWRCRLFPW